jgi:DNA-binding CsgD family transcriptional regulator
MTDGDATQHIDDIVEEIYDAIGDVERWRQLNERLGVSEASGALSHEVQLHLGNARRAHERHVTLMNDVEAFLNVLDRVALGALLVERDGRLLRANASAMRLLASRNGLAVVSDRVSATHDAGNASLYEALGRASSRHAVLNERVGPFVLARRPGRTPLSIVVLGGPGSAVPGFEDLPVALLVVDPDVLILPGAVLLRELFGFTAREAEFAELLMKGLSVEEAARALGVGITTARTFLSQVTAKTDSHGQLESLQRLLTIPGIV